MMYQLQNGWIDKTDGSDTKKLEDYWMKTLKTMTPYGLSIEDNA